MKKSISAYSLGLAIVSIFTFLGCSVSETDKGYPLAGAWRVMTNTIVEGDGTRSERKPQENLYLFCDGYYSIAQAVGDQPSPPYATKFTGTDEEKAARMSSITVNTGTYKVSGSTITFRPIFALVPEFSGGMAEVDYEISGGELNLRWRRILSKGGVEQPRTEEGGGAEATLVRIH